MHKNLNGDVKYTTESVLGIRNNLSPYSIGLENLVDRLYNTNTENNYPPYNLVKENDEVRRLEIAAAGFKASEISVYTEKNQLVVTGTKSDNKTEDTYIHRSLSSRNFQRVWNISDDIRVKEVTFSDGLLIIRLDKVVPEHQRKKVHF